MHVLKTNLKKTFRFISDARLYYRDVLLMHGFLLFILTPLLSHLTRLILNQGEISYLSYDNLGMILQEHPFVFLSLLLILLLLLLAVYFEFTFLLLTVFFIEQRQEITLRELLKGTLLQLRKIRIGTLFSFCFIFSLFYHLLV